MNERENYIKGEMIHQFNITFKLLFGALHPNPFYLVWQLKRDRKCGENRVGGKMQQMVGSWTSDHFNKATLPVAPSTVSGQLMCLRTEPQYTIFNPTSLPCWCQQPSKQFHKPKRVRASQSKRVTSQTRTHQPKQCAHTRRANCQITRTGPGSGWDSVIQRDVHTNLCTR